MLMLAMCCGCGSVAADLLVVGHVFILCVCIDVLTVLDVVCARCSPLLTWLFVMLALVHGCVCMLCV